MSVEAPAGGTDAATPSADFRNLQSLTDYSLCATNSSEAFQFIPDLYACFELCRDVKHTAFCYRYASSECRCSSELKVRARALTLGTPPMLSPPQALPSSLPPISPSALGSLYGCGFVCRFVTALTRPHSRPANARTFCCGAIIGGESPSSRQYAQSPQTSPEKRRENKRSCAIILESKISIFKWRVLRRKGEV